MPNPYRNLPPTSFWRTAVAETDPACVFPMPAKRFRIASGARIATAGSCFAQEVGKYLAKTRGVELLLAEKSADGQPLFSALYGNIYTVAQLAQLFDRAYGASAPTDQAWRRGDGAYVDPFRPYVFPAGFANAEEVARARAAHLEAVRRVFSECSIFVFTLGLTESWRSKRDGAVLPVAPGLVSDEIDASEYEFHNFDYDEVLAGLSAFVARLRRVNPGARIILTVSPVPLIATYTADHVLIATTYSKAVLRAACGAAEREFDFVYYFPSYEIISSAFTGGRYYNPNLRTVTAVGVDHVMETFRRIYLDHALVDGGGKARESANSPPPIEIDASYDPPICDEEEIVRSIGFD